MRDLCTRKADMRSFSACDLTCKQIIKQNIQKVTIL